MPDWIWRKVLLSRFGSFILGLGGCLCLLPGFAMSARAQAAPPASAASAAPERATSAEPKAPRLRLLALDVAGRAAVLAVANGPATLLEVGAQLAAWPEAVLDEVLPGRVVIEWQPAAGNRTVKLWVFPLAAGETRSRLQVLRDDAPPETLPTKFGAPDPGRFERTPTPSGAEPRSLPAPTPAPAPEPHL